VYEKMKGSKNMKKELTFKVEIEGLEDKIWREIKISDDMNVADLAYTILATFNSICTHLYSITHGETIYDCVIDSFNENDENYLDATTFKLKDVDFNKNNKMIMEYDFGSTTTFIITYLKEEQSTTNKYPIIVDGRGQGMIEDISGYELIEIVETTDKSGKSKYYYTPGYGKKKLYDYRDFNLENNIKEVNKNFKKIKRGFEDQQFWF